MQTFPKYRELGLSICSDPLPLRCLPPYQHNDIPIWGDLSPEILVPEVRAAIDATTRAREMLAGVPADVFWPLEGALFNAVDDSRESRRKPGKMWRHALSNTHYSKCVNSRP
jgi:hypothetical protein